MFEPSQPTEQNPTSPTSAAAQQPQTPAEQREARRKIMNVPAFLRIPDQHELIACRVLDFSATGVRIAFDRTSVTTRYLPLSGALTLVMPRDRAEVDCKIVWRTDRLMGFKFRSFLRHW